VLPPCRHLAEAAAAAAAAAAVMNNATNLVDQMGATSTQLPSQPTALYEKSHINREFQVKRENIPSMLKKGTTLLCCTWSLDGAESESQ
jgi:hypothetical protein